MKFVIVGAGDVGTSLADRLVSSGHDVVVIEKSEAAIAKVPASLDAQVIQGDGCSPEVLSDALRDSDYFVAASDVDEVNVTACLVAKLLSPDTKRIVRLRYLNLAYQELEKDQLNEYFDLVINPELAGAEHVLSLFKAFGAKDVVEFADGKLRVVGTQVTPRSALVGERVKSLKKMQVEFPLLAIAIVRDGELLVPRGGDKILAGDTVYSIAPPDKTESLLELMGVTPQRPRHVIIWGGSDFACFLATAFADAGIAVKLIVNDVELARRLVGSNSSVLLLQGYGTDENLLAQENINSADAFVAASTREEDNILAALLAKQLGAHFTIALVNRATYTSLVSRIGVDVVISSHVAAAAAIFRHIHASSVLSEFSLSNRGGEFVELRAENHQLCGKRLEEIKFPFGALVAAIVRNGNVIIPGGQDMIEEGDLVVLFVAQAAKKRLQKLLDVQLEMLV